MSISSSEDEWVLDWGASSHTTSNRSLFRTVRGGRGLVQRGKFQIPDLLCDPNLEPGVNIISCSQLVRDHGLSVKFFCDHCEVMDVKSGLIVGSGRRHSRYSRYELDYLFIGQDVDASFLANKVSQGDILQPPLQLQESSQEKTAERDISYERVERPQVRTVDDDEWVLDTRTRQHHTSNSGWLLMHDDRHEPSPFFSEGNWRGFPRYSEHSPFSYERNRRGLHAYSEPSPLILGSVNTERFKVPGVLSETGRKIFISVLQLARDHGLEVVFEPTCCYVRDPATGKNVGRGRLRNGVYVLEALLIGQTQDVVDAILPPLAKCAQESQDYTCPRSSFNSWGKDLDAGGFRSGLSDRWDNNLFAFSMDSCASHHKTSNGLVLKSYHADLHIKPPENISGGLRTFSTVNRIGYLDCEWGSVDRVLSVYENGFENLVSVSQLTEDYSARVVFHGKYFLVQKLETKEVIGDGHWDDDSYVLRHLDVGAASNWVLDISASRHHTPDKRLLYDLLPEKDEEGTICGSVRTQRFKVPRVRHIIVDKDRRNVISVAQLASDHGLVTVFEPRCCYVKHEVTGAVVGKGSLRDNAYFLDYLIVKAPVTQAEAVDAILPRGRGRAHLERVREADMFGQPRFDSPKRDSMFDDLPKLPPHEEETRTRGFYMDLGAVEHVTWNEDVLKEYGADLKPPLQSVPGIGYIDSKGGSLDRVKFDPKSRVNLVSVTQLTEDYPVRVIFRRDDFWIEMLGTKEIVIGQGHRDGVENKYVVARLDAGAASWVLDTNALLHHTPIQEMLSDFKETAAAKEGADELQILGHGSVETNWFQVPNVRCTAGGTRNVISVTQLASQHGLVSVFGPRLCYVKHEETGDIVGHGRLCDGKYVLRSLRISTQDKVSLGKGGGGGGASGGARDEAPSGGGGEGYEKEEDEKEKEEEDNEKKEKENGGGEEQGGAGGSARDGATSGDSGEGDEAEEDGKENGGGEEQEGAGGSAGDGATSGYGGEGDEEEDTKENGGGEEQGGAGGSAGDGATSGDSGEGDEEEEDGKENGGGEEQGGAGGSAGDGATTGDGGEGDEEEEDGKEKEEEKDKNKKKKEQKEDKDDDKKKEPTMVKNKEKHLGECSQAQRNDDNVIIEKEVILVAPPGEYNKESYVLDNSISIHATPDCVLLGDSFKAADGVNIPYVFDREVSGVRKLKLHVAGRGNINTSNIQLDEVLCLPGVETNLVSVSKLTGQLKAQVRAQLLKQEEDRRRRQETDHRFALPLRDMGVLCLLIDELHTQIYEVLKLTEDKVKVLANLIQQLLVPKGWMVQLDKWYQARASGVTMTDEQRYLFGQLLDRLRIRGWCQIVRAENRLRDSLEVCMSPDEAWRFIDKLKSLYDNPQVRVTNFISYLEALRVPQPLVTELTLQLEIFDGKPDKWIDRILDQIDFDLPFGKIDYSYEIKVGKSVRVGWYRAHDPSGVYHLRELKPCPSVQLSFWRDGEEDIWALKELDLA